MDGILWYSFLNKYASAAVKLTTAFGSVQFKVRSICSAKSG